MDKTLHIGEYQSPIGVLTLAATDNELVICMAKYLAQPLVDKLGEELNITNYSTTDNHILAPASNWLDNYFSGAKNKKEPPLLFSGSSFQNNVWRRLTEIPYGSTASYSDIARAIGNPKAVRATANAIGANRLWIFIPCHRVIGTNGQLTGYAGGLDAKKYLLELEARFK